MVTSAVLKIGTGIVAKRRNRATHKINSITTEESSFLLSLPLLFAE